jgi:hypothetical protein
MAGSVSAARSRSPPGVVRSGRPGTSSHPHPERLGVSAPGTPRPPPDFAGGDRDALARDQPAVTRPVRTAGATYPLPRKSITTRSAVAPLPWVRRKLACWEKVQSAATGATTNAS